MYIEELLENFDFEQSISLVSEIKETSNKDVFLRNYTPRIEELAKSNITAIFGSIYSEKDSQEMESRLNIGVKSN